MKLANLMRRKEIFTLQSDKAKKIELVLQALLREISLLYVPSYAALLARCEKFVEVILACASKNSYKIHSKICLFLYTFFVTKTSNLIKVQESNELHVSRAASKKSNGETDASAEDKSDASLSLKK